MSLGHILRNLFDGHNSHHSHHSDYRDHHVRYHDYHHHSRHRDDCDDYDCQEECNSVTYRGGNHYHPVSRSEVALPSRVVICLSCEAENPQNAKFCTECGSVLRLSRNDW